MPKVTTYSCSRCSGGIDRDRSELVVRCGPLRARLAEEPIDLGPCCLETFVAWLSAPAPAHEPALSPSATGSNGACTQ